MRTIFFDSQGMLRSGWRAAIFLSGFIFLTSILGIVAFKVLEGLDVGGGPSSNIPFLLNSFLSLTTALIIAWLCAKYIERLPFRSLGTSFTKRWHQHLAIGLAFGAGTIGIAIAPATVAGGLSFMLNSTSTLADIGNSLALSLLVFGAAAAFEEIIFRGYVLQTFARSGLAWMAIVLTSVFFGIVHMGNPNSGVISTLNTMLAGAWFGIAYLRTRDLWFVWGLHLMWNWVQGAVLGIEVSGITSVTSSPLFREVDRGPTWLTGQEYGIEGGLVCTVALTLSGLMIYKLPGLKPDPELLQMTTPS